MGVQTKMVPSIMKYKNFVPLALALLLGVNATDGQSLPKNSPWSLKVYVSPLNTNMVSRVYKDEEVSGFGMNGGADVGYVFYEKNKLSLKTAVGMGITNYNNQRKTDFTNQLWTSEFEETQNAQQSFLLTENAKGLEETDHLTYLDVPIKFGANYNVSARWDAYASLGITFGFNLSASYRSNASLTRSGLYPEYNVLLYDVDVEGSPYYYPTNKPVSGSGTIKDKTILSTEAAIGGVYKLNDQIRLFSGIKIIQGLTNVKSNPTEMILASDDHSLNTLYNRKDKILTRALGLEMGVEINLDYFTKRPAKKPVASAVENATIKGRVVPGGSTVLIKKNDLILKTIVTDDSGLFEATLPKGVYDIEISAGGYEMLKKSLELSSGSSVKFEDYQLQAKINTCPLSATIVDALTNNPIRAKVTITTNGEASSIFYSDEYGNFATDLPFGKVYNLEISCDNYVSQNWKINLTAPEAGVMKTIGLKKVEPVSSLPSEPTQKMEKGAVLRYKNIVFKTGTAVLSAKSYPTLDQLYSALKKYPKLKLEISGHTDNVGNPQSNLLLSQKRATAVKYYLIKKGIVSTRLKAIGFGKNRPISDNKTEAGRALNRRVEFKVIEM
jgi:outer membrane protein OmpA-like peptidoglycan-associated protein